MKKTKEEVLEIVNKNCSKIKSELKKKGYIVTIKSYKDNFFINISNEKECIFEYIIDLIWEKGWITLERRTSHHNKYYLMAIEEVCDDDIYKHFFKYFEESPGETSNT